VFIKYKDKAVNTDIVTHISIYENKWVFHLNYQISSPHNELKKIPDYVEFYPDNNSDVDFIDGKISSLNWISNLDPRGQVIVNPSKIGFVKYDDERNRIILNLTCSASLKHDYSTLTSDFVYFTYQNKQEYNIMCDILKDELKIIEEV
jgi:hypothetical protein